MSCDEAQALLDAYVDGELDLVRSLEIEKHLEGCRPCARAVENRQALGGALRTGALYHRTPRELKPRIDAALRRTARSETRPSARRWPLLAIAAGVLLALFFVLRTVPWSAAPAGNQLLAQEVLDSHMRALMPGHLADVPSSDRHTVKPWFNGKIDFSPPVADFAEHGFPLAGGRLDSLEGHTVAVLIYQRRQHVIDVYVWPAPGMADSGVAAESRQGFQILHWIRGGMNWWVASDLNSGELESFAAMLRSQGP